ncbi:MAG: hypothetical protein H0V70_11660 [Ktedonobacteraceae bacterium]|nr:hypothetical protein [Ktedonobacteraceae bacterium]
MTCILLVGNVSNAEKVSKEMGKMGFSASNGKHVPADGGHYCARGERGQRIEVLPEVYQRHFEAYLNRLGVKPTTYYEIMTKAEQEWHAFAQLMDDFAQDTEQWQHYRGKDVFVEGSSPFLETRKKE